MAKDLVSAGGQPDPGKIAGRYDLSFDFTWFPEIIQKHGLTPPS